jgi:hypothetical protein
MRCRETGQAIATGGFWCHPTLIGQDLRAVTVLSARVPDVVGSISYILHRSLVIGVSV